MDTKIRRDSTKDKYIKLTLHAFNTLSFLVGVCLTLFGFMFVTAFKYENNYLKFWMYIFTISILIIGIMLIILFVAGLIVLCKKLNIGIAIFTVALIFCSLLLLGVGIWSHLISKNEMFTLQLHKEVSISMDLFDEYNPELNYTKQVNLLQTKFKCCGLNNYKEWKFNLALNKNSVLKKEYLLNPDQIPFDLPDSCCVKPEPKCGKGYVSKNSINTNGCYSVFKDYLISRIRLSSIVAIGFACVCFVTIVYLLYSGITTEGNYYIINSESSY